MVSGSAAKRTVFEVVRKSLALKKQQQLKMQKSSKYVIDEHVGKGSKNAKKVKRLFLKQQPPRMTPDEKRLARELHFDRGVSPSDVATILRRDLSCICRLCAMTSTPKQNLRMGLLDVYSANH